MNRRGFLKMLAGGAAAVGAAFALPRVVEDAVTAPVAQTYPLDVGLPPAITVRGPVGNPVNIENRTFVSGWDVGRDGAMLCVTGSVDADGVYRLAEASSGDHNHTIAFPNYDEDFRLARAALSDEEYYRFSPQDELAATFRLAKRWAMTPTQVREFVGEFGTARAQQILYGERIKPSADFVDW